MADADQSYLPLQQDAAGHYMAYRSSAPEQAAGDALLKELSESQKGTEIPTTAARAQPNAQGQEEGWFGRTYDTTVRTILRAADIVDRNAAEVPRGTYQGARDAVQNAYDLIDDFAKWGGDKITQATGYSGIHIGEGHTDPADAVRSAVDQLPHAMSKLPDPFPILDNPLTTPTGALAKGVAQFLAALDAAPSREFPRCR